MGFRLGSFLAGMAEGAIEIEEDVRKRNEKIIDATLEANANRRTEEMQARREREREYKLLAKKLSSLDGMDDNKINLVLSYGIDEAKTFAEKAPEIAAEKGIPVGDIVDLADTDAPSIDPETFIVRGDLIDMPQFTPLTAPVGLKKSPIFGRDYSAEFEQTSEDFYSGLGIPSDADIDVQYSSPEGRIKYEDMILGDRPEIPKLSPNQVRNSLGNRIANALGVGASYSQDGSIRLESEDKELQRQANSLLESAYGTYNESLRQGDFDVDYDQDKAMDYAFNFTLDSNVRQEVPEPSSTTGDNIPPAPEDLPETINIENIQSPAVLAQALMQQAAREGRTMTTPEANAEAKRILDQRKANAR